MMHGRGKSSPVICWPFCNQIACCTAHPRSVVCHERTFRSRLFDQVVGAGEQIRSHKPRGLMPAIRHPRARPARPVTGLIREIIPLT
jgi:hypothetical protein